jgi:hypothetical protein
MAKYTSRDSIAYQLKGQVAIGSSNTIGGQSVTTEWVDTVINRYEAVIDSVLSQIYEMPLTNQQPIVTLIVDGWVKRELLKNTPQASVPAANTAQPFIATEPEYWLAALTAGFNIQVPGVPQAATMPGVAPPPQPIVLPGERLRLNPPDTITKQSTVVASRSWTTQRMIDVGIDFGPSIYPKPPEQERKYI